MKHNDTNPRKCDRCPTAHWGINGRYCQRLNRYVTHAATPPCEKVLQTKKA